MRGWLQDVRRGDSEARSRLYQTLQKDERVGRTIRSLTYERSVIDKEDVKAEFWRGVLHGMAAVRHDVGDPIMHLIQRGVWQVKSVVKGEIGKRIVQYCAACRRCNGSYRFSRTCEKCKAPVENRSRHDDIGDHDFAVHYVDRIASTTTVRVTRRISERQRHLLELLIQTCLDNSEHPQADIARVLGISRERVRQHLEKLRPLVYLTTTDFLPTLSMELCATTSGLPTALERS